MALAFLKELLGDAYTEQLDAKISEAVGKGFVAKAERDAAAQTTLAIIGTAAVLAAVDWRVSWQTKPFVSSKVLNKAGSHRPCLERAADPSPLEDAGAHRPQKERAAGIFPQEDAGPQFAADMRCDLFRACSGRSKAPLSFRQTG